MSSVVNIDPYYKNPYLLSQEDSFDNSEVKIEDIKEITEPDVVDVVNQTVSRRSYTVSRRMWDRRQNNPIARATLQRLMQNGLTIILRPRRSLAFEMAMRIGHQRNQ